MKYHFWNTRLLNKDDGKPPAGDQGNPPNPPTPPPEGDKDKTIASLLARLDALEKKNSGVPPASNDDQDSLADKARKEREKKEKEAQSSGQLESALRFTMGANEWLKINAPLLPKSIADIFAAAEKEKYGSTTEKAAEMKVGLVQEFFALQENLDLLTDSQKNQIEEFKKLTKTDKQDRVQQVYDAIFEPTFTALKRIKKAEQLSKGLGDPASATAAYNRRMEALSAKHFRVKGTN